MATIHDVARAAGVSPMTVSNVINNHPNVTPKTREKVLDAIAHLDYRINVAARNLRTGRTGTIGLAVPEIDRPYFGRLAAAIIEAAAERKLSVAIEQTGATREGELSALSLSRNRLYDGLILSTVGLGQADTELLTIDYPVVLLGERSFDRPVDHVAMPNVEGARAATTHLIERGCRRIAVLDDGVKVGDTDVSTLRHAGYRQALADAGIAYDPALIAPVDAFTMQAGADAARRLVTSGIPFDGVFCVTDTVAMGALRAFATLGVRVPHDAKVIGYDNIPEGAVLVPALSTIDPDHDFMARTAVELLVARIGSAAGAHKPREVISGFRVVERESTAR